MDTNKNYKIDYWLLLKNYCIVILLVVIFSVFSKLQINNVFIDITIAICCTFYLMSFKKLLSVQFVGEEKKVDLIISNFFFIKKSLDLKVEEIKFRYSEEIVGRGMKSMVLSFYNKNEKIIRIIPVSSGWSEFTLSEIVSTCKDLNMDEATL